MNLPSISSEINNLNIKDKVRWGKNVIFGPNCREISIGYSCFIGNDIYIDVEKLEIGDYCTIHHGSVLHGKSCTIGHNTWIPLHSSPAGKRFGRTSGDLDFTTDLSDRVLRLPLFYEMKDEEVYCVVREIKAFYEKSNTGIS